MAVLGLMAAVTAVAGGAVNITLLPLETGAAALDGSTYGFFFVRADNPKETRWTMSIEGGGWCVGEESVAPRAPRL